MAILRRQRRLLGTCCVNIIHYPGLRVTLDWCWLQINTLTTDFLVQRDCWGGFRGHIKGRGPTAPRRSISPSFTYLSSSRFSVGHDIVDDSEAQVPRTSTIRVQLFMFMHSCSKSICLTTKTMSSESQCKGSRIEENHFQQKKKKVNKKIKSIN